jgi:DNA-binding XRE family transcriptional regulator
LEKLQLRLFLHAGTLDFAMTKPQPIAKSVCHNRVAALMAHTSRYSFRGTSRLAKDSHVAKSTICHINHGRSNPLYKTVAPIIKSLEFQLARRLNVGEVFSEDGTYPTKHVCKLVGCRGCLPDKLHDSDGSIKPQWAEVQPGRWTGDVAEFEETGL